MDSVESIDYFPAVWEVSAFDMMVNEQTGVKMHVPEEGKSLVFIPSVWV